jgi:hypothetical protein
VVVVVVVLEEPPLMTEPRFGLHSLSGEFDMADHCQQALR